MIGHVVLSRELYEPSADSRSGRIGVDSCESLFTHLRNKVASTEECRGRQFLVIQQALDNGEMDNVFWLPVTEDPAGCLASVRSDMVSF